MDTTTTARPGVDPTPVRLHLLRLHLLRLRVARMTASDIAAAANVTKQNIHGILRGARTWLQAGTAARILAVPVPVTNGPACRDNPELAYDDTRTADAKAACLRCPVRDLCRDTAIQAQEPWGVWGGLTVAERERHRAGAAVVACAGCGLDCVPATGEHCTACRPPQPPPNLPPGGGVLEPHRELITSLSLDAWPVPDIAALVGCRPDSVIRAQQRWGLARTPAADGRVDLKPCGTVAAARRHQRRGEPLDESCRAAAIHNTRAKEAARRRRKLAGAAP